MQKDSILNSTTKIIHNDYLPSSSTTNLVNCEYTKNSMTSPFLQYNICDGILAGGAIIQHSLNLVINIGGLSNGFAIIKASTPSSKIYNLIIDYISNFTDSPLKIDINNINTGTIYFFPKTDLIKSFTIPIFLKKGLNEIKFYGDGFNYGPNLKTAYLIKMNYSTDTYYLSEGNLINNAKVRLNTGFVYMLGGPMDGASILEINIKEDGIYSLTIDYLSGDCSRNIAINVNNADKSIFYCFPKTFGWSIDNTDQITLYIELHYGLNTLKFHGDGFNYGPNIEKFSVEKFSTNPIVSNTIPTTITIPTTSNTTTSIPNTSPATSDTIPTTVTIPTTSNTTTSIPNTNTSSSPYTVTTPNDGNNSIYSITYSKSNIINKCNGIILNGSAIIKETFIEGIGGINNGCAILIVEIPYNGYYDFAIPYVTLDNNKKIRIDVNGLSTGIIYDFEKTLSLDPLYEKIKIIKLSLIKGKNVIKIY